VGEKSRPQDDVEDAFVCPVSTLEEYVVWKYFARDARIECVVTGYPQEASEEDQTCTVKTPGSTQRRLMVVLVWDETHHVYAYDLKRLCQGITISRRGAW
jgi:hypothetical protein